MTEKQILLLIADDSTRNKGYRALMDMYQEKLYQHVRRIVNNHEDTHDVLQNTFVKVFQNIENFKANSRLYTWLYRIATNEALNVINKRKNHFNSIPEENNGIENQIIAQESPDPITIQSLLKKAIKTLPQKQKIVFSLRYFEEMNYREMSSVLNTSEGALKASFHHAVKKIETYIKQANIYQ